MENEIKHVWVIKREDSEQSGADIQEVVDGFPDEVRTYMVNQAEQAIPYFGINAPIQIDAGHSYIAVSYNEKMGRYVYWTAERLPIKGLP